ncbi:MAG: hypothetical protein ACKOZL_06350 [Actinomycetes bacterium]
MSPAPAPPHRTPRVVARLGEAGADPATVRAAVDAGAAMVEIPFEVLVAGPPPAGVPCIVAVEDAEAAVAAIERGAAGLRVDATGPARDELVALAAECGLEAHVPIGRGLSDAVCIDVGELDPDAADDLLGRLAALADLAAAGRAVVASIAAVGPDATATLAALATERGATVLRVVDVASAVRAAAVLATIGGVDAGRPR